MNPRPLPEEARSLCQDLLAPPRLIAHLRLVHDVAASLILLCQLGRCPLWHAHELTRQQLLGRFEPEPVADLAMHLR
jgi:hypothetical protein